MLHGQAKGAAMQKILLYYAHPGQHFSQANAAMFKAAQDFEGITRVDLYRDYPRFDIDPDREQQRLLDHDIILFQFPMFWYSTPSILKEWQDIVLEHGFAYGSGGTRLAGKRMMLAITAAGPQDAYSPEGHQRHALRSFLRPLEQTAVLCGMAFLPPYVLYGALKAQDTGQISAHVAGYLRLLRALRDGRFDGYPTGSLEVLTHETLPVWQEV